jgi:hypothetical protein
MPMGKHRTLKNDNDTHFEPQSLGTITMYVGHCRSSAWNNGCHKLETAEKEPTIMKQPTRCYRAQPDGGRVRKEVHKKASEYG